MSTLKPSDTKKWCSLPRGEYGCGQKAPKDLLELKLLDFKEDLICGFYRGEIRKLPKRQNDSSSDEEDDSELEGRAQADQERVRAAQEEVDRELRIQQKLKRNGAEAADDLELTGKELHEEKQQLLSLTPLRYQINKQQREEILESVEIWKCDDLSKAKIVHTGDKSETLYMIVKGTCRVKMVFKDGHHVEVTRGAGDWFPYAMATDSATPYDLEASSGSVFLVLRGKKSFDRLIRPVIKHMVVDQMNALMRAFRNLPPYEAVRLLSIATVFDARKDQVVVREGTVSSNLVVLVHGNCLLSKGGSRLSSVAAPHIFGQVSVYCNVPNPVSVITTTSAEFILLPKNHLIALVQSVAGLNSVAQRLEIDSSVGVKWHFQRATEASIFASKFGGNTSVCTEEMRQRNLMSEAKGKPMNPAWAADEIPKSKPPKTTPLRPDLPGPGKSVKEVRRPASAMANRKPVIYTRELSTEIEGRLVVGDQEIVGSPDMRQAVDVTKAGHESAGQNQPDSMTPSLKAQYRPHSAMSIRSGLKESFEAASGGSMSIPGPYSREASAGLAQEEFLKYIESLKSRTTLNSKKEEKLDQPHMRFLKQTDMKLESGSSALTNTYIARAELTNIVRFKAGAERDILRQYKEDSGHVELGSRHGVLRERLQRTMNKGTASAIKWARRKVADE